MRSALAVALLVGLASSAHAGDAELGTLSFRIVDAASGEPLPVRVTVVDGDGRSHVAASALPVAGECMQPAPPGWARAAEGGLSGASVADPASGAKAFYVDAPVAMEVAPGRYRVTATRGFEWKVSTVVIDVASGQGEATTIALERWADLPSEGWYAADTHVHVSRPTPELDPIVATWMAAEDLQVVSLLQMGRHGEVVAARQYAFGEDGLYRASDVLLAAGQENPRTWLLGHGIVLGADEYLDPGEEYLVYQPVWRRAQAEGALVGYAHWNPPGVLVDAPSGLVDFLEVLQLDTPNYEMLYRLWDLGILLTPTAGTDFPCIGDLPGASRVYARVPGTLEWGEWLEALRRGRTFVTNGPLLSLEVDGVGIGDRVRRDAPGVVRVTGAVRFDPTRDDVRTLEVVRDGHVVHRATAPTGGGEIAISVDVLVTASGWIALRASGVKLDRRPHPDRPRESAAHTGPIAVRVSGTAEPGTGKVARNLARQARSEVAALRARLGADGGRFLLEAPRWFRGVSEAAFRASWPGLVAELAAAEAWYAIRGREPSGGSPDSRTSPRTPGDASRPPP
jgi:hypothetical protein